MENPIDGLYEIVSTLVLLINSYCMFYLPLLTHQLGDTHRFSFDIGKYHQTKEVWCSLKIFVRYPLLSPFDKCRSYCSAIVIKPCFQSSYQNKYTDEQSRSVVQCLGYLPFSVGISSSRKHHFGGTARYVHVKLVVVTNRALCPLSKPCADQLRTLYGPNL